MTTLWITIHVLTAIVGFGPAFAFPFIGAMAEREPAIMNALARAIHLIATRLVIPLALTQAVTGVILIFELHLNLTKNSWLGISIILYIAVMVTSIRYQLPLQNRIIQMSDPNSGSPVDMEKISPLVKRVKIVGMGLTTAILVIAVLMVWQPGFTPGT